METPVPIPNTEVKHLYADGSKFNLARVGSCQAIDTANAVFFYIYKSYGIINNKV